MPEPNEKNTLHFENADKKLTLQMVNSNHDFGVSDIRALAEVGALSTEDAQALLAEHGGMAISPKKRDCQHLLHKKAVILIAKEKQDQDFLALCELHKQMQGLYERLESKYGLEASTNQGSLLGKLMGSGICKQSGSDIRQKIAIFN